MPGRTGALWQPKRERSSIIKRDREASPSRLGATISEKTTKSVIDARISRLRSGNFGKSEPIGAGASESKIDIGPGYRIYYGVDGPTIILLHGGDKRTQESDIKLAKQFWSDYKARKKQTT
jgi:putative addiction module killer protein